MRNLCVRKRVKVSIVGSLRDREVACSASDRQGSNFESCVWKTVSSQSSHHPQEVLLAQFSLYVHKGGLKPDSFHLHFNNKMIHVDIVRLFFLMLFSRICSVSKEPTNTCYISQQNWHIETMLVKCWVCVADGGSTLNQCQANIGSMCCVCWNMPYYTQSCVSCLHVSSQQCSWSHHHVFLCFIQPHLYQVYTVDNRCGSHVLSSQVHGEKTHTYMSSLHCQAAHLSGRLRTSVTIYSIITCPQSAFSPGNIRWSPQEFDLWSSTNCELFLKH